MRLKKGSETAREAFRISIEANEEPRGVSTNGPLAAEHAAQKARRARRLQHESNRR